MAWDAVAAQPFAGEILNRGRKRANIHAPGLAGVVDPHTNMAGLKGEFIFPPFSVLNTREGLWQDRKRLWLGLGIESELGRGGNIELPTDDGRTNASIFDPVLCELMYTWFCTPGGVVLDPFAGGSVRGIVASKLGHPYWGVDLSARQVEANTKQGMKICGESACPHWLQGDSRQIRYIIETSIWGTVNEFECDFIFSCPPYADLEVYSDHPQDISRLRYPEFKLAYNKIITKTCRMLKPNRFAVFVVGEVRDQSKQGSPYYGFVPDTIRAFENAGLSYYNELVLVTAIGSLPVRAGPAFRRGRKIGRTHQSVLVFCKGDGMAAAKMCEGKNADTNES